MSEAPQEVYNRVMAPGYDPSKLLERAKTWKDYQGVPGFVARTVANQAAAKPNVYLDKVKQVSKDKIIKFIEQNPNLFKGVGIMPTGLVSKIAEATSDTTGIGAAAGASLPASSLIQYYLGDYRAARDVINTAPIMSGKKLNSRLRPGDIGISGEIKPSGTGPMENFLNAGSRATTGSPLGHAFGVGGRKAVYHSGANHSWALKDGIAVDRLGAILQSIGDAMGKKKSFAGRYEAFQKSLNRQHGAREKILGLIGQGKSPKKLDSIIPSFIDDTDKNTISMVFRNKNAPAGKIKDSVSAMRQTSIKPYSSLGAISTGLQRVFLPKVSGKPSLASNSAMCSDAIGASCSILGGGIKGRSMPVDVFSNKNLTPVGIATGGNMASGKVRDILMSKLKGSAIARTGLGIGAMAAGGAIGGAVEKGINTVGEGINSFLSGHNKVS